MARPSSDGASDGDALDSAADAPADTSLPSDGGQPTSDGAARDGNGDAADVAAPLDGGDGGSPSDAGTPIDASSDGPICPPEMRRAGWSILGAGFTASGMNVSRPSLVVTTNDRPTLAWAENARVEALEWVPQDCAFELMGIARFGHDPSLAATANDRVVMASVQSVLGTSIVIETFDGASWTRLYSPLQPTGSIGNTQGYTRIVLDAAGLPVVGWIEQQFQAAPKLHVARWNAGSSSWVRLTDATGVLGANVRVAETQNGVSSLPFDLILGTNDQPIVSWRTTTSGPTVANYDGAHWVQMGPALTDTASFSSADVNAPVLRMDSSSGSLYVVWSHLVTATFSANVATWSGTTWTPLGGALKTAPGSLTEYGMALDRNGVPIVASVEVTSPSTGVGQQIFTYRYSGGISWLSPAQPLDGSDPPSILTWPSIVVDHSGRWLVTWSAEPPGTFSTAVYLARFTPTN